jgi:predicted nucleotidyltransferase component of viral defense system
MIPQAYITAWRNNAPWQDDFQVEQDLIIERALVEIFSDPFLKERVAFRGGTALHKLHLKPAARYSEDIDLVQIKAESIKDTIKSFRERLNFLGTPVIKQKAHNNTLLFRFDAEGNVPMRLKIEINCREHFSVFGLTEMPVRVDSRWFSGTAFILTYSLEELLGTKLRALYQRKKGRDLFDMWHGLNQKGIRPDKIIEAWKVYLEKEGNRISRKEFLNNMDQKISDKEFLGDINGLLHPGFSYDIKKSYEIVRKEVLERL